VTVTDTTDTPDIRIRGLSKRYGDVAAVDGIDLDIAHGEFFTMLGPSGSGKTTTLRMIAGFELPDAGSIELGGEDVSSLPPFARDVNTVFQDYALFPHMTVAENVAYGLEVRRVEKAERRERTADALRMVQLEGYGDRKPGQLSGGQRQRVALARAIVNRPRVLLLDEPLGALDLKLRQEMQIELKAIQQEVGITFVYVTHDQEEALTMSDRIAVMHAGKVEQVGTPEELYERPASRFVADFIGTTNLLHGVIEPDGSVRFTSGESARVAHDGIGPGADVEISVRPESISLVPAAADGAIRGEIEQAAYLGASVSYQVRTAGGLSLSVLAPKTGIRLPVGSEVAVAWSPSDALVLGGGPERVDEEEQP
jgi:putative spermidine/putrescine transport system ATP-binding protein